MNRSKKNRIPVNIWDDFWGDDCVPEGEIQETVAYVEDHDMPEEERIVYIKHFLEVLKTLDLPGVEMDLAEDRIGLKHLTHARPDDLIDELEHANLTYGEKWFDVYSES